MIYEAQAGIHAARRTPPAAMLGYNAEFDAGSAVSRTRRTLREARISLGTRFDPFGAWGVDVMIRSAVSRGFCAPSIDGIGDETGRRKLDGVPAAQAMDRLDRCLARLDGLVADITEPAYGIPVDAIPAGAIDPELGRALAEANRRLRAQDDKGLASLKAAVRRLAALSRTDIRSLGDRLGLPGRAGHLDGVVRNYEGSVPLGTLAYALVTLEALAYRHARRASA